MFFFKINLCTQSPVRPLKEEETSLWMSPEKQYPDDFEPYESEDMEVESRHDNASVCVCACMRVCVRACGCIWARGGAMCQMQLSVLFSISPSPSLRLHRDFPLIQTHRAPVHALLIIPAPRGTPPSCRGKLVQQIRSTTRRCFSTLKKLR